MNSLPHTASESFWTATPRTLVPFIVSFLLLLVAFRTGLLDLMNIWETQEEYSFGYIVPIVAGYLVWLKRGALAVIPFEGSWSGVILVTVGLAGLWVGTIGTLGTIVQYSFLITLFGLVLSCLGVRAFRVIAMPMAILCFMVPLPNYFLREVSALLQLWSSQLGVVVIRAFGISVHLEGNVIDLGSMRLQVVEACSGLRYLFSLMTIGFIAAYVFRAPLWKRSLVFFSTLPITLLMNSLRIGIIGVLVEHFGRSMAEGFLHDFEGWAVFMLCTAIVVGEMAILTRIGARQLPFAQAFALEATPIPNHLTRAERGLPLTFLAATALVSGAAALAGFSDPPRQLVPERRSFADFPLSFGHWQGRANVLDSSYLEMLKLDDYVLADYALEAPAPPVNLYVAYYAKQTDGNSAHSPRACIPGDGWQILSSEIREVPSILHSSKPLAVNRAVIQKGENRQVVYYWFQQRGRYITNEYSVKLSIFFDAVTRHRTDGAMVRLVAPLRDGESEEVGDKRLEQFSRQVVPALADFIPD